MLNRVNALQRITRNCDVDLPRKYIIIIIIILHTILLYYIRSVKIGEGGQRRFSNPKLTEGVPKRVTAITSYIQPRCSQRERIYAQLIYPREGVTKRSQEFRI